MPLYIFHSLFIHPYCNLILPAVNYITFIIKNFIIAAINLLNLSHNLNPI